MGKFIEGIHNYCDRWCERCSLRERCLLYSITIKRRHVEDEGSAAHSALATVKEGIDTGTQMLRDMMRDQALSLGEPDLEKAQKVGRNRWAKWVSHELTRAGRDYAIRAGEWFKSNQSLFKYKQEQLKAKLQLGIGGAAPEIEAGRICEAVEVINWDRLQIAAKIFRAVSSWDLAGEDEHGDQLDPVQTDWNGSAKVALLGIERSMEAWLVLRESLSDPGNQIVSILAELGDLKRSIDEAFPTARDFVRPGFDTNVSDAHRVVVG